MLFFLFKHHDSVLFIPRSGNLTHENEEEQISHFAALIDDRRMNHTWKIYRKKGTVITQLSNFFTILRSVPILQQIIVAAEEKMSKRIGRTSVTKVPK